MRTSRHTNRDVLRDKGGLSTSIVETLGGLSLKTITIAMVGGLLSTLIVFWAVATASADTSAGFQTSSLGFEKAVSSSDVVVGISGNKVGLLKDVAGSKCEVSTWQKGARDGGVTLNVDTKTVTGVCTSTTTLTALGGGDMKQELLFGIENPAFTYTNLGGRDIVFGATGSPTLATGTKPADVKLDDWDDVRPYKVALKLETLDKDTAKVTKKAALTAFTSVVNVSAAADDLRYIPSPSTDPMPGPINITGVVRSTTTGTVYAGAREGVAVSFAGGVCPVDASGNTIPTKVKVSYTQQSPSAQPAVGTVFLGVLTGSDTTVQLGSVPNGSSGAVDVSATCIDGGVVESDNAGFTQLVPATVLTVNQNAAAEKHDLTWVKVSSLTTTFEVRWTVGATDKGVLVAATPALAYQSVNTVGANYGYTSTYSIIATVDTNNSPEAEASITNAVPAPAATVVTSNQDGASWSAVSCVAGTTPQYASRYYQQTGTNTTVTWTTLTAWTNAQTLTGVATPGYGRTVAQVHTRCVANVSGVASIVPAPDYDVFYAPEAMTVSAARSATTGTAYMGAHEGMTATHSGARCYAGTSSTIAMSWKPVTPSGENGTTTTRTIVPTGTNQSVEVNTVMNGQQGNLVGTVTCTAGKSSTVTKSVAFTQTLPAPGLTVTQNAADEKHDLSWSKVSSLPTSFELTWVVGSTDKGVLTTTNALAYQAVNTVGANYGSTSTYTIVATVGSTDSAASTASIANAVPAPGATVVTSDATGADWTTVSCKPGTVPQYASRYYQQTGTGTGVSWTALSAWSTGRTLTGVTTPGYGRTIIEVQSRCVANVSGAASSTATSNQDSFYAPEAVIVSGVRSATTGTAYMGAREGMTVTHSGGRCYSGTPSRVVMTWSPITPSGQIGTSNTRTFVPSGSAQSIELDNVKNGAQGQLIGDVTCTAGKSSTATKSVAFTQALPNPGLTVTASGETHTLTWGKVSSLPTSFVPDWSSTNGTAGTISTTTALTTSKTHVAGSTYGQTTYYGVRAWVGSVVSASFGNTATVWPAASGATGLDVAYINVSSRTFKWTNGAACPAGTTRQTYSNQNLKHNWGGGQVWRDFEMSAWGVDKTSDYSDTGIDQGYPYEYEVVTKCVSAYGESPVVKVQSPNFWNGWNRPATPVYNAYTNWRKTEQPTTSIYDICRNHGTSTCSKTGYGNSIQVIYNTSCPGGSTMGDSRVHSTAWTGGPWDIKINSWDGWETGGATRDITYGDASYNCKTPWGNSSPTSPSSGNTWLKVVGW